MKNLQPLWGGFAGRPEQALPVCPALEGGPGQPAQSHAACDGKRQTRGGEVGCLDFFPNAGCKVGSKKRRYSNKTHSGELACIRTSYFIWLFQLDPQYNNLLLITSSIESQVWQPRSRLEGRPWISLATKELALPAHHFPRHHGLHRYQCQRRGGA